MGGGGVQVAGEKGARPAPSEGRVPRGTLGIPRRRGGGMACNHTLPSWEQLAVWRNIFQTPMRRMMPGHRLSKGTGS